MTTFEEFAFQTPLYSALELPDDLTLKAILAKMKIVKVDGHCPGCGKSSTFTTIGADNLNLKVVGNKQRLKEVQGYHNLSITCARNSYHAIRYWFLISNDAVVKVGQHPSLADIANDEAATYRHVLDRTDASELHKAIGLAAHGVGIGSFVYLRRVFERLIYSRFSALQNDEGWDEEAFMKLQMDKKVKWLKGHIPDFLYEHRDLYSILSKGIHELSEEDCLAAFEPLKLSLKIILEDDMRKKENLALRTMASDAIKALKG